MPSYIVTAPDGRKLKLTGDHPPTEADLDQIFKSQPAAPAFKSIDDWAARNRVQISPETQAVLDANNPMGQPWMAGRQEETFPQMVMGGAEDIGRGVEHVGAHLFNTTPLGLGFRAKYGQPFAVPGESMLDIPFVPYPMLGLAGLGSRLFGGEEAARGLEKGAGEIATGFTTPGSAATAPLAEFKPVQAYFALQGLLGLPGSYEAIKHSKNKEEASAAITHGLANLGMVAAPFGGALLKGKVPEGIPADVEAAAQRGGLPQRRLGITGIDPNVLTDIPPDLVELTLREGERRIVGGPIPAVERIRGIRTVTPEPIPEPTALKAEPLGGQISFNAPAEAGALPSARQAAVEQPTTGGQNAPITRQEQISGESEHKGITLGQDVRPNGPEIRSEESPSAVSGNRSEQGGTELPKQTAVEQIQSQLGMSVDEIKQLANAKSLIERRDIIRDALAKKGIKERPQAGAHNEAVESAIDEALNATIESLPLEDAKAELAPTDFDKQVADFVFGKQYPETHTASGIESGEIKSTEGAMGALVNELRRAKPEDRAAIIRKYAQARDRHLARAAELQKELTKDNVTEYNQVSAKAQLYREAVENVADFGKREFAPDVAAYASDLRERGSTVTEEESTEPGAADKLIQKLEKLKVENPFTPGQIKFGTFGWVPHPNEVVALGKAVWNGGVQVMINAVKAGKTIAEAIDAAIKYMKYNGKPFDEAKMRMNLSAAAALEVPGPKVEGTEQQTRKSAARAQVSPEVPPAVQQRIRTAPESKYNVQPGEDVDAFVQGLTEADLASVPKTSNVYVASRLELANRLFAAGKEDEGYQVFKEVSQTGTDFGQNINQFKRLSGANPANIVKLMNKSLQDAGYDPMTNQQQLDLARKSKASIDSDKALLDAKKKWMSNPTDANAKAADAFLKAAREKELELQREIARYKVKNWPQMLKAFAQGNPLTAISHVANMVGNTMGAAVEGQSRSIAAFLDTVRAQLTGGKRYIAVRPITGAVEASKGFARGLAAAPDIVRYGAGDVVKGETRQGLQPFRSFMKAFAANPDVPTINGKVPFSERVRLAVEGTFGVAPETMLRFLAAEDRPAYEAARARLIAEQAKLHNLPDSQLPFAQRFPELFFDAETIKQIKEESAYAVFQNPSKAVSFLENLIKQRRGGDWADLAFTLMVAPYKLTPWNLVGRTLSYHPLVAMVKMATDAAAGNVRGAELNAGRMAVGTILYGAGYFLYKSGLIGPSLDTEDEQQKNRLLAGQILPPNHVNISGLKRLAEGGDPKFRKGDETWDLTRGGGAPGAVLASVANIGRAFEKKPTDESFYPMLLVNSAFEQASFTINQSFLKGVTGVIDAVKSRDIEPYLNSVENMMLNVGVPNTLSTLSRATRKYMPDLKGDTIGKSFENVVRNRFGFAGADDYLPIKRDLWGEPMLQTPEGRNSLLYHFFDISKNKQVTDDPVALELYDLWRRTANNGAIPSIPVRRLTVHGDTYALTAKQYEQYAELVGRNRRKIVDQLIRNPEWQNRNDELKLKILDNAYTTGLEIGKAKFIRQTPKAELVPKEQKAGFR